MNAVVDGHLHLFRKSTLEFPRTAYAIMAEEDREELAEKFLTAMDSAQVGHAIVVPLSKEDDYLRDVLQRFPGKFAGVGIYDHDRPDDVVAMRLRCALTNLQGLRFFGLKALENSKPRDLECFPILELMAERGMVVWFYGDLVQIRALDRVMEELPRLKVVLNHCGFLPDFHAEMQIDVHKRPHFDVEFPPAGLTAVEALAAKHQLLHVHFSGHYAFTKTSYPYYDLQDVADRLLQSFGAKRMLMASDWPWIEFEPGYTKILGVIDHLLPNISTDERNAIRGSTALSLFSF